MHTANGIFTRSLSLSISVVIFFSRSLDLFRIHDNSQSLYRIFIFIFTARRQQCCRLISMPLHQWMQELCADDGHTSKRTRSIYIVVSQQWHSCCQMFQCIVYRSVYQWRHFLLLLSLERMRRWQKRKKEEEKRLAQWDYRAVIFSPKSIAI